MTAVWYHNSMKGSLPDVTFYAIAVVWFLLIAIMPRKLILTLSLGRSHISDTGAKALRWLSMFFAVVSLANLVRFII